MKISKKEAKKIIERYFSEEKMNYKKTKKIKLLAMKFNIKIGKYRKKFCKKCYSDLTNAKIRLSKKFKKIVCGSCGFEFRLKNNVKELTKDIT